MPNDIESFIQLLNDADTTEHDCQFFIEENTELIYTPFLLNHGLHFNSVISKFPLDTSLITDFAYLSKSTVFWHLVLVELESPKHTLFRSRGSSVVPTYQLTKSIAQIHSWQDFVRRNQSEVIRRLGPILKPLSANPIHFKYLLVMGRRGQEEQSQAIRDRLSSLGDNSFIICTYDSLISAFENNRPMRKNILVLSQGRYKVRQLNADPLNMLRFCHPEEIIFNDEQKVRIRENGYEIDQWENGEQMKIVIEIGEGRREVHW